MEKINKIPRDISQAEIEKGEVILTPDLRTFISGGSKHFDGGTPVVMPEGTQIFSQKLKADKDIVNQLVGKDKSMSYADMAKMNNTIPYIKDLIDMKSDDLSKKTSTLNLMSRAANLTGIFTAQEKFKGDRSEESLGNLLDTIGKYKEGGKVKNNKNDDNKNDQIGYIVDSPITGFNAIGLGNPKFQNGGGYWENQILNHYKTNPSLYTQQGNELTYSPYANDPISDLITNNKDTSNSPTVAQYQGNKMIGYDMNSGQYKNDDLSKLSRYSYMQHRLNHKDSDWSHESSAYGIKPDGSQENIDLTKNVDLNNYTDFRFPTRVNFAGNTVPTPVDGDIRGKVINGQKVFTDNMVPVFQVNKLPDRNSNFTSIPTLTPNPQSTIPKPDIGKLPGLTVDPIKPVLKKYDPIDDVYNAVIGNDLSNLAGLNIRPPEYNRQSQNIAYTRVLPSNNLDVERTFNMQKETIENSNLPQQVKQAYLSDLTGKITDANSQKDMGNYAKDNENDNRNIGIYNQVTDSNRREKIGYDDNFNKLNDVTMFNYSQAENRLKEQLLNTYGRKAQDYNMKALVSQMGDNYYFDGSKIQYIPGSKVKDTLDPMLQYNGDKNIQKLIMDAFNNEKDPKAKEGYAASLVKLMTGK